jgi:hypothetical protein
MVPKINLGNIDIKFKKIYNDAKLIGGINEGQEVSGSLGSTYHRNVV